MYNSTAYCLVHTETASSRTYDDFACSVDNLVFSSVATGDMLQEARERYVVMMKL